MLWDAVIAMTVFPALALGWFGVQRLARAFARRYPEFGPARQEGTGCGKSCLCAVSDRCDKREQKGRGG